MPARRRLTRSTEGVTEPDWVEDILDSPADFEYDPDELREFLAADLIEAPVAPGFKAQLRRKLWRIVKLRYGRTPPA